MRAIYFVEAHFDEDTTRWTATSNDIPGLVCEAGSYKDLIDVVRELAPQLLAMNGEEISGPNIHISMTTQSGLLAELPLAAE